MSEWRESRRMIREAVRRFVETEIVPTVEGPEHGDLPPSGILRKMYASFGMDEFPIRAIAKGLFRGEDA